MYKIKRILDGREYSWMSHQDMLKVALDEFSKFDDDSLKEEYLTRCYEKAPGELSMPPEKCAKLLVESGTFEGGQ